MAVSAGVALLSTGVSAAAGTLATTGFMAATFGAFGGAFLTNFALGAALNALTPKPLLVELTVDTKSIPVVQH